MMNKKRIWINIPQESRKIIIGIFGTYGIDFEKEFVENDSDNIGTHSILPEWITRKDAAQYACVSSDTIDNWRLTGKIEYIKTAKGRPGSVRIDFLSLRKFLNGMKRKHGSAYKRTGERI